MESTSARERAAKPRPSRAEIETLCLLHTIASRPCTARELSVRLGLRAERAATVDAAVEPLVAVGQVARAGELLRCTPAGVEHLRSSLERFRVPGAESASESADRDR